MQHSQGRSTSWPAQGAPDGSGLHIEPDHAYPSSSSHIEPSTMVGGGGLAANGTSTSPSEENFRYVLALPGAEQQGTRAE
jgi:hypothetical protein